MKLKYALLFWLLFVAGCGITGPDIMDDDIRIKTDKKEYLIGDPVVTLTVENRSVHTRTMIGISICSVGLQQQIESHWWKYIPIIPELDCSGVRIGTIDLAPGAVETAQLTVEVDEDVLSERRGVFRLVVGLLSPSKEDSNIENVFSNAFSIVDTLRRN